MLTIICFLALRETYAPTILERKAAKLRKETGNPAYRSKLQSQLPPKELFMLSILRPAKMLLFSPIVTILCVYVATVYGFLYILFTTFTFVFEDQYHFSASTAGLSFLGSGVGMLCGLFYAGSQSDKDLKKKVAAGIPTVPEDRLPYRITIPGSLAIPAGLFIYGWTTDKMTHWIVPQVGTVFVGFGMICVLMCVQTYLVDAFTVHAASVTAANTVLRSLLGALLPLCALSMYDKIGLGWGNSLLGFIALALVPVLALVRVYGERIRTNPKWQVEF